MPTPQEQAEYEQYLKETGQVPTAPVQHTPGQKLQSILDETKQMGYGDPEKMRASLQQAAAMLGTGGLSAISPKLAGVLGQALEGGAMGAAQAPHNKEDALKAFLTGGAIQGGLAGAGKALGGIGDRAMQWAVGRKKFTPGVGTELADQGVIGTKGMMKNQVANRLDDVGSQMSDVASQIPEINSREIGQELLKKETGRYTGNGINTPSVRDLPAIDKIQQFGEDIASRGSESGAQALARRKTAGSSAFSAKSQEPLQNLTSKLSKAEQQGYSQALKSADPRMVPLDKTYGALKRAELPLNQESAISGFGGLASAAGKAVAQPTASLVGQAGVKGGKLAQWLAPLVRQAAVGQSSVPSDQDRAEYEQYLKETGQSR